MPPFQLKMIIKDIENQHNDNNVRMEIIVYLSHNFILDFCCRKNTVLHLDKLVNLEFTCCCPFAEIFRCLFYIVSSYLRLCLQMLIVCFLCVVTE